MEKEKLIKELNELDIALAMLDSYQTPNQLRRSSNKEYGLEYEETLEMAYENIQTGIKGVRKMLNKIEKKLNSPKVNN